MDPGQIVAGRTVLGGSAPERVREHCRTLDLRHMDAVRWHEERRAHARRAEERLVAEARTLAG
jgi:argininosuccinate lyase